MLKVISPRRRKADIRYCQVCGIKHELVSPAELETTAYRTIGCPQCKKLDGCFVCRSCELTCKYCHIPFVEMKTVALDVPVPVTDSLAG